MPRLTGGALRAAALLALLAGSARASTPPPSAPTSPPPGQASSKSPPQRSILVLVHGAAAAKPRDERRLLADSIRQDFAASGRVQPLLFGPDEPSIKRGLLERRIQASDLIEPISSVSLERLAVALGASIALDVNALPEKQALVVQFRLLAQNAASWSDQLDDQVQCLRVSGRRRLPPQVVAAMAAGQIAEALGYGGRQSSAIPIGKPRVVQLGTAGSPVHAALGQGAGSGASNPAEQGGAPHQLQPSDRSQSSRPSKSRDRQPSKTVAGQGKTAAVPQPVSAPTVPPAAAPPSSSSPAPALPSQPQVDYAKLARGYLDSGDLPNAITMLRSAVTEKPFDPLLRRELIQAYLDRQMAAQAEAEARSALLLMPKDVELQKSYSDALMASGDATGALAAYQKLVQAAPRDIAARVSLADALLAAGRYPDALQEYRNAAAMDPNAALPHRRLMLLYADHAGSDGSLYASALAELQAARRLAPATDVNDYLADYTQLMRRMAARMKGMVSALQTAFQDGVQGRQTVPDLERLTADMDTKARALADFVEQAPSAAGLEQTQKQFAYAAELLAQTIADLQMALDRPNASLQDCQTRLMVEQSDTLREIDAAISGLTANQPGPPVKVGQSAGGS